ncbi:MAG TPA: ImmA/IrrE family metallo-endopeptidase, partial [Ktedonobacterales bacterium]|nr:ImmA/IrrE family metallo-endopeptidase [Ktedonobacterales bacterium]
IERGKRDVKAVELVALAKALHWTLTDLLMENEEEEEAPVIAWRQKPADEAQIAQSRAYFLRLCENYALAVSWADAKQEAHLPTLEPPKRFDFIWARQAAEEIRKEMGLGSIPAAELVQTLEERYSVKILFIEDLPGAAISAHGAFGVAMALKANDAPWRRNYSLAHELFHLLTWDFLGPETFEDDDAIWSEHIESLANTFASSLLLPEASVRTAFERRRAENSISWQGLIGIAREFAVSTEALLWRFVSLNILKERAVRDLLDNPVFRAMDRETFPSTEKPNTYPNRFYRLVEQAYLRGEVSTGRVSEMTGFDLATTHFWLSQLDTEEDEDVGQEKQLVRLA